MPSDALLGRRLAFRMRIGEVDPAFKRVGKEADMELSSFFGSDAALLLFSGLGLIATGLAIARDIPMQKQVAEEPARLKRVA